METAEMDLIFWFITRDGMKSTQGLFSPKFYLSFYCRWDEWVPQARLLKYNEENLLKQKNLSSVIQNIKSSSARSKNMSESNAGRKSEPGASSESPTSGLMKKKRKENGAGHIRSSEQPGSWIDELASSKNQEMKLPIPESLKVTLVDEWESITKNQKVQDRLANVSTYKSFFRLSDCLPNKM
jgi:MRG